MRTALVIIVVALDLMYTVALTLIDVFKPLLSAPGGQ